MRPRCVSSCILRRRRHRTTCRWAHAQARRCECHGLCALVTCGQTVASLGPVVAWRWNANPAETKPNGASRQAAYMQRVQVIRRHACFAMCSSASPSRSARRQVLSRGQRLLVPANRPPEARRAHENPVDVTRLTGVVCAPPSDERPKHGRLHSTQRGRFLYSSGAAQRSEQHVRMHLARLQSFSLQSFLLQCFPLRRFLLQSFLLQQHRPRHRLRPNRPLRCHALPARDVTGSVRNVIDSLASVHVCFTHACAVYRQARTDLTRAVPRRDIARCGQSESRLGSTRRRMLRRVGQCYSTACDLQSMPTPRHPISQQPMSERHIAQ